MAAMIWPIRSAIVTDNGSGPDGPRTGSRTPAMLGAAIALVVVVLGGWGLAAVSRASDPHAGRGAGAAAAGGEGTADGSTAGPCDWKPTTGDPASITDTGTPGSGEPRTGTATMTVTTSLGAIEITIDRARTPCTAASFAYLAGKKFFDGTRCHRLVTSGIYVLQCGDPTASGAGGPSYEFADENLPQPGPAGSATYRRGVVAMANRGPGTNGSQFFINFQDGELAPSFTPFGTVTNGMEIIDEIARAGVAGGGSDGKPAIVVSIISLTVA
jgi:peptidyl-prolyl cis-trans isomerase B (cyclophilin B)